MHRLVFGYSFAELVAPILLLGLTLYFLNKKKASVCGNADEADTGTYDSLTVLTETNSVGSSSSSTETNNSAPSLLIASTGNCYEVFLSFRGPDTRKRFTDHLYHGLCGVGIRAFRDDDELCQGEDIKSELKAAITNSKILIPIFSKNYGTSSWCLDELVQIMERKNNNGQIVLPIFYKVKPAEVRYQTGRFGKAFHKRESRLRERSSFDPTTLEKWKKALDEVSNLKGYEADGPEAELVKLIVRKVLNELKKKFELVLSENLVGIDDHVKKVMEFVGNKSHDTLSVGIHGMGGIGKTTLAKAIYNELSDQFEHHSFIADIRESWKCKGVCYLQNQLIYDILKEKIEVSNEDEGIKFISSRFKGKKVLVLLDDVDNVIQLKRLAGNRDWFSFGSRIIITTRNKEVLEEAWVDRDYEREELDNNQSLILFSRHAFRKDSPPKEFEDLTREVVSITKGLPLSLEVLGSLLCGKKPAFWGGTIEKLRKVPPEEVKKRLRISYEALEYEQKQIFLDIACFFNGTNKTIPFYMWDSCNFFPKVEIEVLIFMSLIKVENDCILKMHDQLRDLGREIVREENQQKPWYRSRLWDYEEAQKVLKENEGTNKIEAINLSENNSEYLNEMKRQDGDEQDGGIYTGKQFKNLKALRFLYMKKTHLSGDFKDSMKRLKWLQWRKCPASFEVKNFHVKELVVLELRQSKINEKWEGWSFLLMAGKLKYLDLSYCASLEDTKFLSTLKKLEVLILDGCDGLKRIDASIGEMEALLRLELNGCQSLTELPTEIGNLKALQQLNLSTTPLSALPNSIGCLENLEILRIRGSGIEELPNVIGRLRNLQELDASQCKNLKKIMVESMCNLSSLLRLDFVDSCELPSLPNFPSSLTYLNITCQSRKLPSLSRLRHLKSLGVFKCRYVGCIQVLPSTPLKNSECSQLMDVEESESPQSLNTPFKLERLDVADCDSLKTLDVSQFIHLRTLYVIDCWNLLEVQGLDKLICLERLYFMSCTSIGRLDLPKSGRLKELKAISCENLAEILNLDRSEFLESLDIQSCTSIGMLLLPKSERLKELNARDCKNLAKILSLDGLEFLESLDISHCTSIGRLDLPKSRRLKELRVGGCKNLVEILNLDGLEFLESLDISYCTSIGRLDLLKSRSMKELRVGGCTNLVEILSLDRFEFLESLDIERCTSIGRLLIPKFGRLKKLKIEFCENLAEILSLDGLEFLESLNISSCTSIGRLDLLKFGRLKKLEATSCKNLVEILSLDRLEFLESLDIRQCTSIRRLLLPKSGRLKELRAWGCENLAEILSLDRSEFLESLDIQSCTSIGRLLLPKSGRLKKLNAGGCKNLAEILSLDGLEFLESLNISFDTSIGRLDLLKFKRLKNLKASYCKNLAEILSLDRSEFLESLDISECTSIGRLDLPKFGRLKELEARGCKNLVEILSLNGSEVLKSLDISKCTSIGRLLLPKSNSLKIVQAKDCANLVEIQGLDRLEFLEKLNIIGCKSLKAIPELSRTQINRFYEITDGEMTESGSDYAYDSDESI